MIYDYYILFILKFGAVFCAPGSRNSLIYQLINIAKLL